MEFNIEVLARIFEEFILPPGSILLVMIIGIFLINRRPGTGKALLCFASLALYLLSAPYFAGLIADQLETYPALTAFNQTDPKPAVIVILSSERYRNANEYSGETVGLNTLARIRYGAYLQHKTGLPILVSGGRVNWEAEPSLAEHMATVLRDELKAGEIWLEDQSRTTAENAFYSRAVLAEKNIDRIFLVTHAWHMPRSVYVFEKAGFKVVPAPTAFSGYIDLDYTTILPRASGLQISRHSIREIGSILWYRIRH